MAANCSGIEVITSGASNVQKSKRPRCIHGPALLFERYDKTSGALRQFFACSAFRDRKQCNFFLWADSSEFHCNKVPDYPTVKPPSHRQQRKRFREFKKLPRKDRCICCTCGTLLLEKEITQHKSHGHNVKEKVGLKELRHPSKLFAPLDDNKTFAQYLFSENTIHLLLTRLSDLKFSHVLCVGTPRVHEAVQCQRKEGKCSLSSMLLDLDDRYAALYSPSQYAKYNMFTHYFFEQRGKTRVSQFFVDGGTCVVIVTDPPFGGMVEPLAQSFSRLSNLWKKARRKEGAKLAAAESVPLIWFFPYFMEPKLKLYKPELLMLDYKVEYDNHLLYSKKGKKKGSPVRIFTNINPAVFTLPSEEGYWFCKKCQRYSSSENKHCDECGHCTSKDGSTYVHCDMCNRCVKPSRVHCFTCSQCQAQDHVCGSVSLTGCFICGSLEHKRRQCPQKGNSSCIDSEKRQRKRRMNQGDEHTRKSSVKKKRRKS